MAKITEVVLKKYKAYASNIEWHIRVNKPTGDNLKYCEIKLDCYNEIFKDLERLDETGNVSPQAAENVEPDVVNREKLKYIMSELIISYVARLGVELNPHEGVDSEKVLLDLSDTLIDNVVEDISMPVKLSNLFNIVERFADNGVHSHWELLNHDGGVLWMSGNEPLSPVPVKEEGKKPSIVNAINEIKEIMSPYWNDVKCVCDALGRGKCELNCKEHEENAPPPAPTEEQDKEVKEEMVYWCGKHGIATSQCTDFCDEYKGLIPDPRKASNIPPLPVGELNKMADRNIPYTKNTKEIREFLESQGYSPLRFFQGKEYIYPIVSTMANAKSIWQVKDYSTFDESKRSEMPYLMGNPLNEEQFKAFIAGYTARTIK